MRGRGSDAQRLGEPSLATKTPSSPRGDSMAANAWPGGGEKPSVKILEVVDERFHLRLHFLALWRNDTGASERTGPSGGIFFMAWRIIFRLSRISAIRIIYRAKTVGIGARGHNRSQILRSSSTEHFAVVVRHARGAQRRPVMLSAMASSAVI